MALTRKQIHRKFFTMTTWSPETFALITEVKGSVIRYTVKVPGEESVPHITTLQAFSNLEEAGIILLK